MAFDPALVSTAAIIRTPGTAPNYLMAVIQRGEGLPQAYLGQEGTTLRQVGVRSVQPRMSEKSIETDAGTLTASYNGGGDARWVDRFGTEYSGEVLRLRTAEQQYALEQALPSGVLPRVDSFGGR